MVFIPPIWQDKRNGVYLPFKCKELVNGLNIVIHTN